MKKVLFVLLALLMTTPVMAVDFDVYGELNTGMWWDKRERWYDDSMGVYISDTQTVEMGADSLPVYNTSFLPFGKFGFTLKTDRITGCVEMGGGDNVYDMNLSGATGMKILKRTAPFIYLRKWYGSVDLNDYLSILIGQDYAPANFFPSNQAFYDHNSLLNLGCLYTGRIPGAQLTIGNKEGSSPFSVKGRIACLKVDTMVISFRGSIESEVETKIPKFEGRLDLNYDSEIFGFNFNAVGGYERFYSMLRADPSVPKDSFKVAIDNFVGGAALGIKLGPVTLGGTYSYSQNPATYGILVGNRWEWRGDNIEPKTRDIYLPRHDIIYDTLTSSTGNDSIVTAGYGIFNSKMMQAAAVLKVKPMDMLAFEGGFGWQTCTHEFELLNVYFNDRFAYYIQAEITLLEMITLTPEFGQFFWGKEYMTGGRFTYWGMMTSFKF